jgi:hypothetical protein
VAEGIYVAGTLAGWRSQLSIAAGSGAAVATDILTFGITVFRHTFTIVLDKRLNYSEIMLVLPFFIKHIMLSYILGLTRLCFLFSTFLSFLFFST